MDFVVLSLPYRCRLRPNLLTVTHRTRRETLVNVSICFRLLCYVLLDEGYIKGVKFCLNIDLLLNVIKNYKLNFKICLQL